MGISDAALNRFVQVLVGAAGEATGASMLPGVSGAAEDALTSALKRFKGREDLATKVIRGLRKGIGQNWAAWSQHSSQMTAEKLASVEKSFEWVVGQIWLSPEDIARNLRSPDAIADLLLERAAKISESYRQGPSGEADANIRYLREVTTRAYGHLCTDPEFFTLLDPVVQGLQLEEQQRQAQKIDEMATALQAMAEQQGQLTNARDQGVDEATIIELARRVSANVEDVNQALIELEGAIQIAIEVKQDATHPSNLSDFVDRVLAKLAEQTANGQLDEASETADNAIARWERDEAERQQMAKAEGLRLLRAGQRQDLLRRDAAAAAAKITRQVAMESPTENLFNQLYSSCEEWMERGRERSVTLDLQVATELAQITIGHASDDLQLGTAYDALGTALRLLGERDSGTDLLIRATNAYNSALTKLTRNRSPLHWARTQSNLGLTLFRLGERQADIHQLEEALEALAEALEESTRERAPDLWAATQVALGNTLVRLGERENGTNRLEQAVAALTTALNEFTRERFPFEWANAQMNLGTALRFLGERESDTDRLNEAVTAYTKALNEFTRERLPMDWATAQMNLGTALVLLGSRENGTHLLQRAIEALTEALKEITRDRVPLVWGMAQMNLGTALWTLGERETGTDRLEQAVTAYAEALKEYTRDRVPLDWAMTQMNLGSTLATLAERKSGVVELDQAIAAYTEALNEYTLERVPLAWAMVQENLGNVEVIYYDKTMDLSHLERAEEHDLAALKIFRNAGASQYVELIERNIALLSERRAKAQK